MDNILLLAQALLIGFSLLGVASAAPEMLARHLLTLAVATAGTIVFALIPPRWIISAAKWLFFAGILALLLVLLVGSGPSGYEVKRWLRYGSLSFQPSEFMKIALVAYLASFFSRRGVDYPIIGPVLAIGFAAGLIAIEPDLGTALFLVLLATFILVIIGVPLRRLLAIGMLVFVVLASFNGAFLEKHKYIEKRYIAWKYINLDPHLLDDMSKEKAKEIVDKARQSQHSRLILRASGPLGHGPSAPWPTTLPEAHNDMIFTTITYASGWFGALMLLLAYGVIFARGLQIATRSTGAVSVMALGLTGYLTGQALMNITVATGVLPVTGISLPLVSTGGSSLLIAAVALGLLHATSRQALAKEAP